MARVILRPGREKPVLNHHPWIFSGAIGRIEGEPQDGDIVEVRDADRRFLASGYINRHSQISVRLLTWTEGEMPDQGFWRRRIHQSIQRREDLLQDESTTALRLIHAESDLLPGLVVDRYGEYLVLQSLTLGMERLKPQLVEILAELLQPRGIYERSDVDVRAKEHLTQSTGVLWGEEPTPIVEIRENGLHFLVDLKQGQKTGFYLDQRDNRRYLRQHFPGGEVLDAFCYSGGFTLAALAAGAENVLAIDASQPSLELAQRNVELNDLLQERCEWLQGDVFQELRTLRDRGRSFDVVILDPPRFAPTASQAQKASRGYKDINLLAFKLLRPGGTLISYSCSGGISPDLFRKIIAGAALDAGVRASILAWQSQPHDHPVVFNFPEGRYLKGLICRVHPID